MPWKFPTGAAEGAAEAGAAEGAADGAAEGAADAATEGAADGAAEGALDAGACVAPLDEQPTTIAATATPASQTRTVDGRRTPEEREDMGVIPPPPMSKSSPVPADAADLLLEVRGLQSVTVLLPCADVKSGTRRSGVHPVTMNIGVAADEVVSEDEALEASARPARYSIAAASNVLAILRVMANEQYVTLHRAAAEAEVSVSTAYRLLSTLEANGLAERVRGGGYRPGAAALEWAGNLLHRLDARRIALPVIRGLPLLAGETGYLALLRTAGLTAVIILPADDALPLPQNPVSLDRPCRSTPQHSVGRSRSTSSPVGSPTCSGPSRITATRSARSRPGASWCRTSTMRGGAATRRPRTR